MAPRDRARDLTSTSNVADLMETAATPLGENAVLVHVRGEVDAFSAPFAQRTVNEAFELGARRLLIDLDGVKFFGSPGLGLLIETRKRALEEGVKLVLVCSNPLVLRPLALAGSSELFVVTESVETALDLFPS